MAGTTKPVRILCVGLDPNDELDALSLLGHTVDYNGASDYDMIVGPQCWRLLPDMMKFLPLMLKEARAKQPPRVKKAKVKRGTPTM